ncbi:MAG: DUF5931 domain-containing protein [Propionibacteriaceae bacterium]|nr:DUF5931 domain-containing protein [Propionibacteriaceae bacterium]
MDSSQSLLRSMWRAGGLLRFAMLVLACAVNGLRDPQALHPRLLVAVCAVMAAWSVCTWFWNQSARRRTWVWMMLDIVVTAAIVATSRPVLGETLLRDSFLGVSVYWMAAAPIAVAIWKGPVAGAVAGAVLGLEQFLQLPSLAPRAWLDLVCMVIVPAFVGLVATELEVLLRQRDKDRAVAAALAERERLNRIVHDGVLQVLAMVEHEGGDLGPKGVRLARLAGEQETRLRGLLQDRGIALDAEGSASGDTMTDLVSMVMLRESPSVSVSVMAGAVAMPLRRARELDAAIGEALTNVTKHAGPDAHAWILLEEDGGELIVSLRDDGVGMTAAQLRDAAAAGRLGVRESIQGRIRALGGVCSWRSEPQGGLEWEFRVPVGA